MTTTAPSPTRPSLSASEVRAVCFAYNGTFAGARLVELADVLANDVIVATCHGYDEARRHREAVTLLEQLEPKLYRYVDVYGAGYYKASEAGVPTWFPGAADLYPVKRYDAKAHPYHRGRIFEQLWFKAIDQLLRDYPDQAGIFVDDFQGSIAYWGLTAQAHAELEIGNVDAELQRLKRIEIATRARASMRHQHVIVNGAGATQGARLWESVGRWITLAELTAGAGRGDLVLVKGLEPDGSSWARTEIAEHGGYPNGTSFRTVFKDVLELAATRGLIVGLCYQTAPPGQSQCSRHAYTNPSTWSSI